MPRHARSIKHEYELFVEHEIETYKESVARSVLLALGDEAVASLAKQPQLALTELLLCEEVDRLIVRRLRLPAYPNWRRRRLKLIEEMRRPEHWGFSREHAMVREVRAAWERSSGTVLVAAAADASHALFLAAHGCDVTAISSEPDAVERVMSAAVQAGLAERVDARTSPLDAFVPDGPLTAVVVEPAALDALSVDERARVIATLQSATIDGGVHLVQTIAANGMRANVEELRATYRGWDVSVERTDGKPTFLAKKGAA